MSLLDPERILPYPWSSPRVMLMLDSHYMLPIQVNEMMLDPTIHVVGMGPAMPLGNGVHLVMTVVYQQRRETDDEDDP